MSMRIRKSSGSGNITATSAGTANTVAKFTTATNIGNSSISDDGTNVTFTEPIIFSGATAAPPAAQYGIGFDNANFLVLNVPTLKGLSFKVNNVEQFRVGTAGLIKVYGTTQATVGNGVPTIVANFSVTGKTAADTNEINFTPPSVAATYRLSWTVDTRTATTDNFTVVATWQDASAVARSQNSGGFDKNGTGLVAGAITNTIGAGTYYGSIIFQVDATGTAITLSTAGTFTTVTYDWAGFLERIA